MNLPNLGPNTEGDYKNTMTNMWKEAQIAFYEGCPINRLVTIPLLLNVCTMHGVSNAFVDELFSLLKLDLFPKDNTMPKFLYQAKSLV
jgi:hypothetical protein